MSEAEDGKREDVADSCSDSRRKGCTAMGKVVVVNIEGAMFVDTTHPRLAQ